MLYKWSWIPYSGLLCPRYTQKSKRWKSSVLFLSQRVQKSQSFWNHFNIDRWNVSVSRELKEDNTHPAQLYGGKQAPEGFVTLGNNALHNHSGCIIIKAGCYLQGLCQTQIHTHPGCILHQPAGTAKRTQSHRKYVPLSSDHPSCALPALASVFGQLAGCCCALHAHSRVPRADCSADTRV